MRRILALALAAALVACGARSSLPRPGGDGDGDGDGGGGAGRTGDGGRENDGGGGGDVLIECDPDVLYVYVITSETDLYKFDPDVSTFERVGALDCPTDASPFSMAVSRSGRAYSVYSSGELFRVDVHDASCESTDWEPIEVGDFGVFGMGYALDDDGLGESLYVADIKFVEPTAGLARLDTSSFDLDFRSEFSDPPGWVVELTSADDGELYGYFLTPGEGGGTLVRIDKRTAEILERTPLPPPTSPDSQALAFAYWNGDFYIFTGQNGSSEVTRYRPSTGEVGVVATLDREIVGAGVTTCDPDG